MMTISAVVLTKNEEENIKKCLDSLSWCDEIVVIDDGSQDKTREIAKKLGARVIKHFLNNNYAQQRNFGLKKAIGDWVLFVDADERVTEALAAEIESVLGMVGSDFFSDKVRPAPRSGVNSLASSSALLNRSDLKCQGFSSGSDFNYKGFYIKRRDFIFGKWLKYGEVGRIKLLRLAKKDTGQWEGSVHEKWKIKGETGILKNSLHHYPHPTTSQFLEKINNYSTIRARALYRERKQINFFEIIAYPTGKFLKNFFYYFGFLDGLPGFLHAVFMSFHSFLVRGKLWLLG